MSQSEQIDTSKTAGIDPKFLIKNTELIIYKPLPYMLQSYLQQISYEGENLGIKPEISNIVPPNFSARVEITDNMLSAFELADRVRLKTTIKEVEEASILVTQDCLGFDFPRQNAGNCVLESISRAAAVLSNNTNLDVAELTQKVIRHTKQGGGTRMPFIPILVEATPDLSEFEAILSRDMLNGLFPNIPTHFESVEEPITSDFLRTELMEHLQQGRCLILQIDRVDVFRGMELVDMPIAPHAICLVGLEGDRAYFYDPDYEGGVVEVGFQYLSEHITPTYATLSTK